jgi:hypothetical protein
LDGYFTLTLFLGGIMKKISLLVVIFIWLLCMASYCRKESENCHKGINFVNGSSKDVYIYSCIDCLDAPWEFEIPSLQGFNANGLRVKPNEKNTTGLWSRYCYEDAVTQGRVVVYVFDAEILETIPRDTIIKYRMVLKTIYPTIDEMQASDWTITYL